MDNERNPWEVIEEENVANAQKNAIKKRRTARGKAASAWFLGIVKWVLLISVGLFLIFEIFVHPVNKLKLRILLGGSCEINARALVPLQSIHLGTVKIDGNLVYTDGTYYEIDGETVYQYQKIGNEWVKTESEEQILIFGDSDDEAVDLADLLNRRNYERVKGKFLTYRLKDDADINWGGEVEFQRVLGGQYDLTLYGGGATIVFTFENIGRTKLDRPWEQ